MSLALRSYQTGAPPAMQAVAGGGGQTALAVLLAGTGKSFVFAGRIAQRGAGALTNPRARWRERPVGSAGLNELAALHPTSELPALTWCFPGALLVGWSAVVVSRTAAGTNGERQPSRPSPQVRDQGGRDGDA